MTGLLLHEKSAQLIKAAITHTPHALLITGNDSSGKLTVTKFIATKLLGKPSDNHPFCKILLPEKNSISIEQIRELRQFTRLKTTGKETIRRVVIIKNAQHMTIEAQNALLKLLEEPPEDTLLILTATNAKSIRPTIYSRVQHIPLRPIPETAAIDFATKLNKQVAAQKAYSISRGDAGLFLALLHDESDHELAIAIKEAKRLLTSTAFERLQAVETLSKDKDHIALLLGALKRIASAALTASVNKQDVRLQARWQNTMQTIYDAEKLLQSNVNAKLLLTDLFLAI